MKKNAKPAALAILVLAAVAALSVGITLAVVNAVSYTHLTLPTMSCV